MRYSTPQILDTHSVLDIIRGGAKHPQELDINPPVGTEPGTSTVSYEADE